MPEMDSLLWPHEGQSLWSGMWGVSWFPRSTQEPMKEEFCLASETSYKSLQIEEILGVYMQEILTSSCNMKEILARGLIKWAPNEASQTNRQSENILWWGKWKEIRNISLTTKSVSFQSHVDWKSKSNLHFAKIKVTWNKTWKIQKDWVPQLGTCVVQPSMFPREITKFRCCWPQ